jgi:hypothetical protein
VWFVWRSSFVVGGQRYFALFDDAMISMTYARNFVEGLGLSWARWGDPVEGFTCPLWVLLMIPVNAAPVDLPYRSLVIQILSFLVLLLNLLAVRRLMQAHFLRPGAVHFMPAVVLTAFYFPLNHWALVGMETGLQALLVTLSVHLALRIAHDGRGSYARLFAVLSAALLLRTDMSLLVAACLASVAVRRGPQRPKMRRWLPGALAMLFLFGAATGLRVWYFGDLLPNTYYLKMTGVPATVRLHRGLLELLDLVRPMAIPLLVTIIAAAGVQRSRPRMRLPAVVLLLYFAYSAYVGGDAYPARGAAGNRFVAPVMPLLFSLFNGLLNELLSRWRAMPGDPKSRLHERALVLGATVFCLLSFNGLLDPTHLATDPTRRRTPTWSWKWQSVLVRVRPLYTEDHRKLVEDLDRAKRFLDPDALVATTWAGIPAYFSNFRMADLLGYNDRHIARLESRARSWTPGHSKWDYDYVLTELRPDILLPRGCCEYEGANAVIRSHGYVRRSGFWVLGGSPRVRVPPRIDRGRAASRDKLDRRPSWLR